MTPSISLSTSASHVKTEKSTAAAIPIIPVGAPHSAQAARRLHKFGLAHITKPFDRVTLMRMMTQACERIMAAESKNFHFLNFS